MVVKDLYSLAECHSMLFQILGSFLLIPFMYTGHDSMYINVHAEAIAQR